MTMRTLAALLATATIALSATPAEAQRYYAREKLVGLSTSPTYVPVYAGSYGACVGGKKSRAITGCATTAGEPTALSNCSSFPQYKDEQPCSTGTTCGPMAPDVYPSGSGNSKLADNVPSAAAALGICQTKADSTTQPAYCGWSVQFKQVWWYPSASSSLTTNPNTVFTTTCK